MQFWDKTLDFFRALWIDTWATLTDATDPLFKGLTSAWNKNIEGPMDEQYIKALDKFVRDWKLEPENVDFLYKVREWTFPFDFIGAACVIPFIMGLQLWNQLQGAIRRFRKEALEEERPESIDANSAIAWSFRHPEHKAKTDKILQQLGLPDEQIDMLYQAAESLPQLGEILQLLNRGIIKENQASAYLQEQGFTEKKAFDLLQLRVWFPSPQDIVSLAGREAYEEDQIRAYELDKDMPEEMFKWGEKVGVGRDVLRQYWVAHWSNPSINQVFEMIQRKAPKKGGGVWSTKDLDTYFKLADINPYFTESLQSIAYSTYTRVDIRRMYQLGVLKKEDLQRAHEDLGYDKEHAENLTKFVILSTRTRTKDLTKGNLDVLYRSRKIDALKYRQLLQGLGYDAEEAVSLQDIADLQRDKDRVDALEAGIAFQFKRELITEAEAKTRLHAIPLDTAAADQLLTIWKAEAPMEKALPSKQDLVDWLKAGVVSPQEFALAMKEHNYRTEDVSRYLAAAAGVVKG